MEAGVRSIPWVASPTPAYTAWKEGGIIANTLDEWHSGLRQLMLDTALTTSLGKAGRIQADSREAKHIGRLWADFIGNVLHPSG